MSLDSLAQTLKPHVKILAHHALPNFPNHFKYPQLPLTAQVAHFIGMYAKMFGVSAFAGCLCDDAPKILPAIAVASESFGIILQNGIYDNIARWYLIQQKVQKYSGRD
ncbi:hypothetical protein HY484_00475 [Candidatus Woesearchaeota archaeon]|nr:hypothetical protein [Candidatus Woesearchaeota archaeon]